MDCIHSLQGNYYMLVVYICLQANRARPSVFIGNHHISAYGKYTSLALYFYLFLLIYILPTACVFPATSFLLMLYIGRSPREIYVCLC